MADIRIKDLPTTATQTASDDFIALDGTVNGTRKIDASAPSFKTSVTSPSVVAPAATNLTLAGGSTGASISLGQGANAGMSITPTGTGAVNLNNSVNVNGVTGVGKLAVRTGTNENAHFRTATAIGGTGVGLDMLNDANGAVVAFTLRASATRLTGGTISVTDTTAASSTTTGALQVAGGVGVAGAGYFGGVLNVAGDASFSSGTFAMTGGAGSYGLTISNTSATTRLTTSFGGSSLGFRVNAAGADQLTVSGSAVNIPLTTSASSSTAGALTIGNGTAATNVAIGGGNINAGGTGTFGGILRTTVSNAALILDTTGAWIQGPSGGALNLVATSGNGISFFPNGGGAALSISSASVVNVPTTTEATTSAGVGALTTAGGIHAAKRIVSDSTEASVGSTTGAGIFAGGIYAGAASVLNGFTSFNGGASIQGSTAAFRYLMFATGATNNGANAGRRYNIGVSTTAESGSNVGSDYEIRAYDDAGSPLRSGPDLLMTRSTGAATFAGAVTAGGTIKAGAGSGETLSAGSVDVAKDIGIASTQGIVQGGARIVTFTSGAATFAGDVTRSGTGESLFIATTSNTASSGRLRLANSGASGRTFDILSGGSTASDPLIRSSFAIYDITAGAARVTLDSAGQMNIRGSGGLVVGSTTAGSAGAGALVVSGGLATGAASYFGGAVTAAGDITRSGASNSIITASTSGTSAHGKFNTVADVAQATLRTEGSLTSGTLFSTNRASATQLYSESGPLVLGAFGAFSAVIGTNNTARLTIDSAGAATFAGAVAIGNTVNTVSPTSPNRTVTMVIGGVTYYLAAKTTND